VIYAIKCGKSVSVLLSIEGYSLENLCLEISEIIIGIVHRVFSCSVKQCQSMQHGYGYAYRYRKDTDMRIRQFSKKPDTRIRFIIF